MSARRKNVAIESFLVVILMIFFAISVAILIVQGSSTFQKTLEHRETEENLRIAMSYISMSIRQNDHLDRIQVPTPPQGVDALITLSHTANESGLKTYIYYSEGALYECYTDGDLNPDIATKIVPLKGLSIHYDAQVKLITLFYDHIIEGEPTRLKQSISLRSR
jgi:hypothetical protein